MNKKERVKMPVQDSVERAGNFREVALGLSEKLAQQEASRCLMCENPACSKGCPVGVDIPGFIKLILEGDFLGAANKIKETNVLPAVCGRVCPQEQQCEKMCIRAKIDKPVAIGYLERFVADYELAGPTIFPTKKFKENDKKVAIIGSGPAGLTCAGELRAKGYAVTVFEALHETGGVLVYGIPEFRLPKDIVAKEINALRNIGVVFKKNYIVGKTITIDELLEEKKYNAVFVSTGAGYPKFMGIDGEDLNYVYSSNEFLTRINLMKAHCFPYVDTPIYVGNRVAVIGGGNTAMDSARCAKRLGAEHVYLIYRRSRNEMPARVEEVEHAEEEGIEFMFLSNPVKYRGDEQGFVKKIICQKMELAEPDEFVRRRTNSIPGSEFELDIDAAVIAIGTDANPIISQTTHDIKTTERGYIVTDDVFRTTKKGVYAGGDIVTGSATVIQAMGAGKLAADTIDRDLNVQAAIIS